MTTDDTKTETKVIGTLEGTENCVRIVSVPEHVILNVMRQCTDMLTVLDLSFLPKDARVLAVHHNPMYRGFDFLIWSSEFSAIEDYEQVPQIPNEKGWMFHKMVQYKRME